MVDSRLVCHEGKVVGIKDNSIQVKILSRSACAQCHAKGMCTLADMEEKVIDAVPQDPMQIGDTVTVVMEEKLGWLAVFYGFVLPFIVMVTVLFVSYALGSNETKAVLYGIGSLVPYYLLLYRLRKKIEKDFIFKAVAHGGPPSPKANEIKQKLLRGGQGAPRRGEPIRDGIVSDEVFHFPTCTCHLWQKGAPLTVGDKEELIS